MTRDEFTREFAEILNVSADQLYPDTDLTEIPDWDSVAYLSATVLIDDRLGIKIRPNLLSEAKTFRDILSSVESVLQG